MTKRIDERAMDQILREARSFNGFEDRPLEPGMLEELWDLLKWGPTSFNCLPARFLFVTSKEAKARLAPLMMPSNAAKMLKASVCAIIAHDVKFQDYLPQTFPAYDAKPFFDNDPVLAENTMKRNGTLQGAYLMIAARSLGLDVGPMSGFNNAGVDAEFFPDGRWKSNFCCLIGYGTQENMFPRSPRLPFETACKVI